MKKHRLHHHKPHSHFLQIAVFLTCASLMSAFYFGKTSWQLKKEQSAVTPTKSIPRKSPLLLTMATSQWRTFTSLNYQYAIKYPPEWSEDSIESTVIFGKGKPNEPDAERAYQIVVSVEEGTEQSYNSFIESRIAQYAQRPHFQNEEVAVDKKVGIRLTDIGYDWPRITVAVLHNYYIYTITLVYFTETLEQGLMAYPEAADLFEKTVGTMRFLVPDRRYQCPPEPYVDCQPIVPSERQYMCETNYLQWVENSCTSFKGVLY
jgi:hypothetical protein